MPSITTWNRIEPRPRSQSLVPGLQAAVRDPLWLLFRQWQFGEFNGDDSGSPSYIHVASTTAPTTASRVAGGPPTALGGGPIEPALLDEQTAPDLAIRIELGQDLERRLLALLQPRSPADRAAALAALRLAYPIPSPDGSSPPLAVLPAGLATSLAAGLLSAPVTAALSAAGIPVSADARGDVIQAGARWAIHDSGYDRSFELNRTVNEIALRAGPLGDWHGDPEASRLARTCAGRTIDGVAVLRGLASGNAILPAAAPAWMSAAAATAAAAMAQGASAAYGTIGRGDPPAWQPEHLAYEVDLLAPLSASDAMVLAATPGSTGALPWFAFDRGNATSRTPAVSGAPATSSSRSLAGRIAFPGMPARRWWSFEPGATSFPAITADHTDIAKLIVVDFMLVHGDDWFIQTLEVPAGSVTRVDELIVHDVFGVDTAIERAGAQPVVDPAERWTMYSTADTVGTGISDWLLVPATGEPSSEHGPELEVVQLLRDDIADLVWAVDELVQDGVGLPRTASDWSAARQAATPAPPGPSSASLRYVLQTTVPEHWTPFQPTLIDPNLGRYRLRRLRRGGARTWAGRILEPTRLSGTAYEIAEEEVPRAGRRVARRTSRTRSWDGSVVVWTARRSGSGRGEGTSDLRFDIAEPVT